jgi:hypothetical protein
MGKVRRFAAQAPAGGRLNPAPAGAATKVRRFLAADGKRV